MRKQKNRRADEIYLEWGRKHPDPSQHVEVEIAWPKLFVPVAIATDILYISDKWEKDGDWYPYHHKHDGPSLYVPPEYAHQQALRTIGKSGVDTAKMLEQDNTVQIALPILGYVKAMRCRLPSGEHAMMVFDSENKEEEVCLTTAIERDARCGGDIKRFADVPFGGPQGLPIMSCTAAKQNLLIFANPIFVVRGRDMQITERGIVK